MMDTVLIGIGIYAVVAVMALFIEAPTWVWRVVYLAIGIGLVVLAEGLTSWYFGLGAGGVAMLTQRVDDLLLTQSDALRAKIINRRY